MKDIEIGSVVRIKSGGPEMAVEAINKESDKTSVICVYFDCKLNFHKIMINSKCLEVIH